MEKKYNLHVANYYEWKNFKGKGMAITVQCGKKKAFVHGDGYGKFGKLIKKLNDIVYGE